MKCKNKKILLVSVILLITVTLSSMILFLNYYVPTSEEVFEYTYDEKDVITLKANEILSKMSLHDKICQMFIVTPDALSGETATKDYSSALKDGIQSYPVGGLIFFSENIESKGQIKALIDEISKQDEIPMFFSTDQEGGIVARLDEKVGFPTFENMYKYKDMGESKAYENAKIIAQNMISFGFNLDFAPVADVWTNKDNTVIGQRAYSDDYNQASKLVASAVKGFKDGGIICTLKHFPGHGDTYADTHKKLAYISKTIEQLKTEEFLPFIKGMQEGADIVMISHLVVPEIDSENPATLSRAIVTDILKNELSFNGIIITDALNMGAVTTLYSSDELCSKAIKAGADILLMPEDLSSAIEGIENAVLANEISEDIINESVLKILKLKIKNNIIK